MADSETQLEVTLDGETHIVPVQPGQVLIDAMEDAGLEPPFSCRAGCCATCMCQLQEGEVEMLSNSVLEPDELEERKILACQSVAQTARVKVTYLES